MTTLLTFRDDIKAFYSRYDYILTPIFKFIAAFIIFRSINQRFGYWSAFDNVLIMLILSAVCAMLPSQVITGISGVVIIIQSLKVSLDVGLLCAALVIIFYSAYMRFVPKTGIIVFLVPLCCAFHLTYALPILLGFLVGPTAIIPVSFGFILYYYENCLSELTKVLAGATSEDDTVSGFQYVIAALLDNKEILLFAGVCALVILITYCIYRQSVEHSWLISFISGGFLNIALFLVGNVLLLVDVDIISVVTGSIVGILFACFIQFCKGVVDYQKTELLQFEDTDYYYYVKAIPKLSISGINKNVKHINSKINE